MKMAGIVTITWDAAADDRGHWRSVTRKLVKIGTIITLTNISSPGAEKRDHII